MLFSFGVSFAQNSCYLSAYDGAIVKYNSATCDTTLIGYAQAYIYDIAVTPSGRLYGTSSEDLFEIDTNDASISVIANIFQPGFGVNNLVAINDDYLLTISGWELYKVDVTNGDKYLLGTDSLLGGSSGDITSYKGSYYLSKYGNRLIRFDIDDEHENLLSVEQVGVMNTEFEDGVWGILTVGYADCGKDNLRMLAFEGWNVFEVDPETANCTKFCDSIVSIAVTGAASRSEVSKQITEPRLIMPNVFTPNNDNINDVFKAMDLTNLWDLEVVILNRWGGMVYQSTVPDFAWNGNNLSGLPCQEGVYFYRVTYSGECGILLGINGHVTLSR